jgi:hypothetical protein
MRSREDIESFFIRMGVVAEEVDDAMWVIRSASGDADVVIHYSPPVLLLRIKVMQLPRNADEAGMTRFYRRLLELNASDLVHGSYGIEEGDVILSETLGLEDLDFSEIRTAYESMTMAASSHTAGLAELVPAAAGREG